MGFGEDWQVEVLNWCYSHRPKNCRDRALPVLRKALYCPTQVHTYLHTGRTLVSVIMYTQFPSTVACFKSFYTESFNFLENSNEKKFLCYKYIHIYYVSLLKGI